MIPARERPIKATDELICLRHHGRMMAPEEEQRILRYFLSHAGLTDIAKSTGHSQTTVLDVLSRYRYTNGEVLHRSKRNAKTEPRPLMEGVDYPDRASPFAGLFLAREIQPVDLERHSRWQDRLVYGG